LHAKRADGNYPSTAPDISLDIVPVDMGKSRTHLLTAAQRRHLADLATPMRVPPRTIVYRQGDALSWIFINTDGLVKSFRELRSGARRIVAFLFPRDVFGLAENGRYVNTAKTITAATLYRIQHDVLAAELQRDADLEFRFLCKVTQKLREAQRQTLLVGRRDAVGRLAMFLKMLERHFAATGHNGWIPVPMSRTEIADYVGLSLEAVSRATRKLALQGIIAFEDGHTAHVLDRARFNALVAAM
jgi:CRP/FNR family transcriptional regulator, anaerobic regulatory protein